MGKQKYQKEIESLFAKSSVISAESIVRMMRSKKSVKQYNKQLIKNLIARNKIKRLTKGHYTKYDDPSLAVFCFSPAYLGLQDALSFHNLWEQETIPIVITARKIRQGSRKILGANVLIRRIDKKYIFGFEYIKQGEFYLPYSDIEKTFIDLVYFNETMSPEVIKNVRKMADKKKLIKYLRAYPEKFRKKVFAVYGNKNVPKSKRHD